eukprot:6798305-Prymnesium_polylepis.1
MIARLDTLPLATAKDAERVGTVLADTRQLLGLHPLAAQKLAREAHDTLRAPPARIRMGDGGCACGRSLLRVRYAGRMRRPGMVRQEMARRACCRRRRCRTQNSSFARDRSARGAAVRTHLCRPSGCSMATICSMLALSASAAANAAASGKRASKRESTCGGEVGHRAWGKSRQRTAAAGRHRAWGAEPHARAAAGTRGAITAVAPSRARVASSQRTGSTCARVVWLRRMQDSNSAHGRSHTSSSRSPYGERGARHGSRARAAASAAAVAHTCRGGPGLVGDRAGAVLAGDGAPLWTVVAAPS